MVDDLAHHEDRSWSGSRQRVPLIMSGESLPEAIRRVLEAMSAVLESGGEVLAAQAHAARVRSFSPTYIELDIPAACPGGPWPDGPLSLSPTVVDDQGEAIGSILIWVAGGRISLLEQPWYTDEPPSSWPPMERVQLK
jgi:hypothetical protein